MVLAILLTVLLGLSCAVPPPMVRYAYIWVGGTQNGQDHVAVVDVSPGSPTFSAIYYREYIPASPNRILTNSEAHHIFLNYNKTVMMATVVGAAAKDDVYLFDMDPDTHFPHFRKSLTVANNHCSDTFTPYDPVAGTYMLSQRCNLTGGGAGDYSAITLFNPVTEQSQPWAQLSPGDPAYPGFHPHIGFRCSSYVVWANYYPKTPQTHIYQFNVDGTFNQAISLPGASADPLEVQWVPAIGNYPNCSSGIAITGTGENHLVFWQPGMPAAISLIDFSTLFGTTVFSTTSSFFTTNKNGTQLRLLSSVQQRYVLLIDIDPSTPSAKIIYQFDFCNPPADAGVPFQYCTTKDASTLPATHLTKFDPSNNRFFVNNYFTAAYPGTRSCHLFQFSPDRDTFTYVSDYHPDMEGGSPHGLVYGEWKAAPVVAPPLNDGGVLRTSFVGVWCLVVLAVLNLFF